VTYTGNNRTHMIRIPGGGRFEFRLGDGAANPYLLPAALLAAGLDGIAKGTDPGKPLHLDMYAEGHKAPADTRILPLNLLDALRLTAKSQLLRRELGDEFVDSYVKLKTREWNDYMRHLSGWERANTLDC
jgi:glutamine synthetase